MNKVILVGRPTADVELKTSVSAGDAGSYANFSLAVNRQKKGEADFFYCSAFGKTAELLSQYVHKGDLVGVEGKLRSDRYETKDGQKRESVKVMVDKIEFLQSKREGGEAGAPAPAPAQAAAPVYVPQAYAAPAQQMLMNQYQPNFTQDGEDLPF